MQSATPCSSSALVSLEQSINNYSFFSKETENKRSFTYDKVVFTIQLCKNSLKNTTLENILQLNSPQERKTVSMTSQKTFPSKFLHNIRSRRKSEVIMIAMHKSQTPLHIKNTQKQLTASKIQNVRKRHVQGS